MRSRGLSPTRLAVCFFSVSLIMADRAYAQAYIVEEELLEEWFYSRLAWAAVLGLIAGALVGAFHLCRLEFPIHALSINGLARRKFALWLLFVAMIAGILLLLDAWLFYPFGPVTLTFSEALGQVWFNYRTLLVLLCALAAFSISVAVTTRVTPGSHCPYAFLPGPRGK